MSLFFEHFLKGETLRSFQRSRYYDSTMAALIRAGVRVLFSTGPDDTATLLAQLAQVEQRKGQAISVPVEVKGRRQQALQFYLTLPCVSYVNALYMCNRFYSVAHLINRYHKQPRSCGTPLEPTA